MDDEQRSSPERNAPDKAQLPRVDEEDLDMDWRYQQTLWKGQPFTGIGYELHPNGNLVAETEYDEGFARASREWYGPDQLREEHHYGPYGSHGMSRAWYPSGQLKSEMLYEHGIRIVSKAWDEQGALVQTHQLGETDDDYAVLQRRRRLHSTGPLSFWFRPRSCSVLGRLFSWLRALAERRV